jgi:hypothetical protein
LCVSPSRNASRVPTHPCPNTSTQPTQNGSTRTPVHACPPAHEDGDTEILDKFELAADDGVHFLELAEADGRFHLVFRNPALEHAQLVLSRA